MNQLANICAVSWPTIGEAVAAALTIAPRRAYQAKGELLPETPPDLHTWVETYLLPELEGRLPDRPVQDLIAAGLLRYLIAPDLSEPPPANLLQAVVAGIAPIEDDIDLCAQFFIAFGCGWQRPSVHADNAKGWDACWPNALLEVIFATETHFRHVLRRLRRHVWGFGSFFDSRLHADGEKLRTELRHWVRSASTYAAMNFILPAPNPHVPAHCRFPDRRRPNLQCGGNPLQPAYCRFLHLDFWNPLAGNLYAWISTMLCGSADGHQGPPQTNRFINGHAYVLLRKENILVYGDVALRRCLNQECEDYNKKRPAFMVACDTCGKTENVFFTESRLVIPKEDYYSGGDFYRCPAPAPPPPDRP